MRLRFAPVAPDDLPLARFIYSKRHYTTVPENGGRRPVATAKAFEPPRNDKLSTMHTRGIDRPAVWSLDPTRSGKIAIAAAHIVAEVAASKDLDVRMDNRPQRHVTIRGWPVGKDQERFDRIEVMLHLASAAEVQLRGS